LPDPTLAFLAALTLLMGIQALAPSVLASLPGRVVVVAALAPPAAARLLWRRTVAVAVDGGGADAGAPLLNLPVARAVVDRAGRLREREGVVAAGEAAVVEAARKLEVLRKEVEGMLPQGGGGSLA